MGIRGMSSKTVAGTVSQPVESLEISEQIALIRDLEMRHEDLFRKLEELESRVTDVLTQWGKCPSKAASAPTHSH
jgi:rubrerythrin